MRPLARWPRRSCTNVLPTRKRASLTVSMGKSRRRSRLINRVVLLLLYAIDRDRMFDRLRTVRCGRERFAVGRMLERSGLIEDGLDGDVDGRSFLGRVAAASSRSARVPSAH